MIKRTWNFKVAALLTTTFLTTGLFSKPVSATPDLAEYVAKLLVRPVLVDEKGEMSFRPTDAALNASAQAAPPPWVAANRGAGYVPGPDFEMNVPTSAENPYGAAPRNLEANRLLPLFHAFRWAAPQQFTDVADWRVVGASVPQSIADLYALRYYGEVLARIFGDNQNHHFAESYKVSGGKADKGAYARAEEAYTEAVNHQAAKFFSTNGIAQMDGRWHPFATATDPTGCREVARLMAEKNITPMHLLFARPDETTPGKIADVYGDGFEKTPDGVPVTKWAVGTPYQRSGFYFLPGQNLAADVMLDFKHGDETFYIFVERNEATLPWAFLAGMVDKLRLSNTTLMAECLEEGGLDFDVSKLIEGGIFRKVGFGFVADARSTQGSYPVSDMSEIAFESTKQMGEFVKLVKPIDTHEVTRMFAVSEAYLLQVLANRAKLLAQDPALTQKVADIKAAALQDFLFTGDAGKDKADQAKRQARMLNDAGFPTFFATHGSMIEDYLANKLRAKLPADPSAFLAHLAQLPELNSKSPHAQMRAGGIQALIAAALTTA